jgi:dTDP-4-amino-4,6-dideoxygalactose transaminase
VSVPQTNPGAGYRELRAELDAAIAGVLESGWYILGGQSQEFERDFAAYVGAGHAVGVANGTDAVELALRAAGIGDGDRVATVSHTAVATVVGVEQAGARPVLIDIDARTFNIDPNRLEDTLRSGACGQLKAVLLVHLYGRPGPVAEIKALCDRFGLLLVEDCAQAHGAAVDGRKVGSWGFSAAFSFYPTKNLGAFGDGGAVVTSDGSAKDRLSLLRQYGWKSRFLSDVVGKNSRLDELQAAVLRVKLRRLDEDNRRRRAIAARYDADLPRDRDRLALPEPHPGHVYHQYVVRAPQRDALAAHLKAAGVGTLVHYPFPVHLQPAYRDRVLVGAGGLPNSERAAAEVLSLPMFPQMTPPEVDAVIEGAKSWLVRP